MVKCNEEEISLFAGVFRIMRFTYYYGFCILKRFNNSLHKKYSEDSN